MEFMLKNIAGKGDKRTMMVLYRSPENQEVKVYNGYKYQIS